MKQSSFKRFLGFCALAFVLGIILVAIASGNSSSGGGWPRFIIGTLCSLEPAGLFFLVPILGFTWMKLADNESAGDFYAGRYIIATAVIVWIVSAIF